jgi:hypothetical protein
MKCHLAHLPARCADGIQISEAITGDGATIFRHACWMDLEGIISKCIGSRYVSGRTRAWLKTKNPHFRAVVKLPPRFGPEPRLMGSVGRGAPIRRRSEKNPAGLSEPAGLCSALQTWSGACSPFILARLTGRGKRRSSPVWKVVAAVPIRKR